jgi:hypothetical protein
MWHKAEMIQIKGSSLRISDTGTLLEVVMIDVLLLSQADLKSLQLSHEEVLTAIEQALCEHAAGSYEMHPKIGVHPTATDPGERLAQ